MSVEVFKAACRFRRNGEQVPFDKLVNSPSVLLEVTTDYNRRNDDDDFMPSNWANKASSTKGKRVVKP
jgi:hypothetical protein